MSTINNTDTFLIARGTSNYKVTAADVAAYTGGGGGGGVTGVGVTAPITDTGTATAPIIGIAPATTTTAGSLSAADKVKIDALPATIVSNVTGTLPIAVATGTTTPVVSVNQGLGVATNGNFLVAKVTEATTPPAAGTGAAQAVIGSTYYDTNLGAMFIYYSNGGTPTWVMV